MKSRTNWPQPKSEFAKLRSLFSSVDELDDVGAAAMLASVRRSTVYQWLAHHPDFNRALSALRNRVKQGLVREPSLQAELIFIEIVVTSLLAYYQLRTTMRNAGLPADARAKALRHIDGLQAIMRRGLRLESASQFSNAMFTELLSLLRKQLSMSARKGRFDENYHERNFCVVIAFGLVGRLGISSPSILMDLASIVDYQPDPKTFDRYVSAAKRHLQLLTTAMPG